MQLIKGINNMETIIKAKESMSAKERVLSTFMLEKTDRVPIGYDANGTINNALIWAVGAKTQEELLQI